MKCQYRTSTRKPSAQGMIEAAVGTILFMIIVLGFVDIFAYLQAKSGSDDILRKATRAAARQTDTPGQTAIQNAQAAAQAFNGSNGGYLQDIELYVTSWDGQSTGAWPPTGTNYPPAQAGPTAFVTVQSISKINLPVPLPFIPTNLALLDRYQVPITTTSPTPP